MKAGPSTTARISRPATVAVRVLLPTVLGLQPVGATQRMTVARKVMMQRRTKVIGAIARLMAFVHGRCRDANDPAQRPPPETPGRLQESPTNYPNRLIARRCGG